MQVMKYVASQKKPEVLLGKLLPEKHLKVKSKEVIKKIIELEEYHPQFKGKVQDFHSTLSAICKVTSTLSSRVNEE